MNDGKICGVERERYQKIVEAESYKGIYGFTDSQCNAAYELSETCQIPLLDAFGYVYNFCSRYLDAEERWNLPSPEDLRQSVLTTYMGDRHR